MVKLALGTAQFGLPYGINNRAGQVSVAEGRAILEHARVRGVDTLDTAIAYGTSEARLGEMGVRPWRIVTKMPSVAAADTDIGTKVDTLVRGSLERLGVTQLAGLLLHRSSDLLGPDGAALFRALVHLREQGVVQKIGVSIYDPAELDALCSTYQFDLVQAPFNLLDRRLVASGWLDRLADSGTEVHVRSVFLQGLLLMEPSKRPVYFAPWARLWSALESWLDREGLPALHACLMDVWSFPTVSRVIVGVDSLDQLKSILQAIDTGVPRRCDQFQADEPALVEPSRWPA